MAIRFLIPVSIALLFLPFFVSASACPNLTRNLSFGSRGTDVTQLQNFLISQGHLAAGNSTGYFGRLTEAAIKKFQCRQNIVCAGTPRTTGYGAVGPRTRVAIKASCGATTTEASPAGTPITFDPPSSAPQSPQPQQPPELALCPIVPLPIGKPCTGTWKEVKDTQGKCTASWQCVMN